MLDDVLDISVEGVAVDVELESSSVGVDDALTIFTVEVAFVLEASDESSPEVSSVEVAVVDDAVAFVGVDVASVGLVELPVIVLGVEEAKAFVEVAFVLEASDESSSEVSSVEVAVALVDDAEVVGVDVAFDVQSRLESGVEVAGLIKGVEVETVGMMKAAVDVAATTGVVGTMMDGVEVAEVIDASAAGATGVVGVTTR